VVLEIKNLTKMRVALHIVCLAFQFLSVVAWKGQLRALRRAVSISLMTTTLCTMSPFVSQADEQHGLQAISSSLLVSLEKQMDFSTFLATIDEGKIDRVIFMGVYTCKIHLIYMIISFIP
jgi:hypothetical protein